MTESDDQPAKTEDRPAEVDAPAAHSGAKPVDVDVQFAKVVSSTVFIRGANRPFGELTRDDAQFRGAELKATVGWGPTAKVAPIARAWRELSEELGRAGVATVGELPRETVIAFAPKLWVVPPRGSLL